MSKTKFNTIFRHPSPVSVHGDEVSLTDPQYLADCDINTILKKFQITGQLPSGRIGVYGDFSDCGTFSDIISRVNKATADFENLPSDVRARFGHDASAFYDFVLNPDNHDECCRLGIISERPHEETALDVLHRIADGVTAKAAEPSTSGSASAA